MPKRKTIEEVLENVFQVSNGRTKVLSDKYVNEKTPLILQCECGEKFEREYDHIINRKSFLCDRCTMDKRKEKLRMPFEQVVSLIEENGCEYIDGTYLNNSSLLTIRCYCGEIFKKSMHKFLRGQDHCPKCGMKALAEKKTKYNIDIVRDIFAQHGYILLDDEYKGCHEKHKCECEEGHECYIVLSQLLIGRSGCTICAINGRKGENSSLYIDGRGTIQDALRNSLSKWKEEVANYYNNTCPITGETNESCDVHHLTSLKTIFNRVCKQYNVSYSLTSPMNSFERYELFDKIRNETVKAHTLSNGIYISSKVHRKFHKQYGSNEANMDCFKEFLLTNYNLSLSAIVPNLQATT